MKDLAKFVEVVADIGFGKTRKQIKAMVEKIACERNFLRKSYISDGWFRWFFSGASTLAYFAKGDHTAAAGLCVLLPDDEYQCSECFGTYKEDNEMELG